MRQPGRNINGDQTSGWRQVQTAAANKHIRVCELAPDDDQLIRYQQQPACSLLLIPTDVTDTLWLRLIRDIHVVTAVQSPQFDPVTYIIQLYSFRLTVQWRHSDRKQTEVLANFLILRSTCNWRVTTYVGKPSVVDQPTRPTQPFIHSW